MARRLHANAGRLAEKLVLGRQDAFLGWFFDIGKFHDEYKRKAG